MICCGDAQNRLVNAEINLSKKAAARDHKLLLLGPGSSGKSTFFKQLCKIHNQGYQRQELEQARQNIFDCLIDQMKQLLEMCYAHIENHDDGYTLDGAAFEAAKQLSSPKIPRGGIEITPEIAGLITALWSHPAIKLTFEKRTNLGVVDSAPHFFEDIDRIANDDYQPTDDDILLVRIQTTGIRTAKFEIDSSKFELVDVGGQRNECAKWVHQFSVVDAVLFVCSLSCYDQKLFEEDEVNAMHESIRLFDLVVNNRYFRLTSMILFLNKRDLFDEKIMRKSIKPAFPDYQGPDQDGPAALRYITDIFLKCALNTGKEIYTHLTTATNSDNVKSVFHDVQHGVVTAALTRNGIM